MVSVPAHHQQGSQKSKHSVWLQLQVQQEHKHSTAAFAQAVLALVCRAGRKAALAKSADILIIYCRYGWTEYKLRVATQVDLKASAAFCTCCGAGSLCTQYIQVSTHVYNHHCNFTLSINTYCI